MPKSCPKWLRRFIFILAMTDNSMRPRLLTVHVTIASLFIFINRCSCIILCNFHIDFISWLSISLVTLFFTALLAIVRIHNMILIHRCKALKQYGILELSKMFLILKYSACRSRQRVIWNAFIFLHVKCMYLWILRVLVNSLTLYQVLWV